MGRLVVKRKFPFYKKKRMKKNRLVTADLSTHDDFYCIYIC